MINNRKVFWVWNESLCHQNVNTHTLFSPIIKQKCFDIPTLFGGKFSYTLLFTRFICTHAFYATIVAYEIFCCKVWAL